MPERVEPGHYRYGQAESRPDGRRPRESGEFGVIKGKNANQNQHLEWNHICPEALHSSKWFAYRIGPGDNGKGIRTDLMQVFDTKKEAGEWLCRRIDFDEKF